MPGADLDLADRLRRQVHHGVNVARQEGVQTRDRITDAEMLDLVEIAAFTPVIVEALTDGADTRLEPDL